MAEEVRFNPDAVVLDLGRAVAYVRGVADAARQALACDPELQGRTIHLGGDFSVTLAGRPGECGLNSRTFNCIPGYEGAHEGTATDTVTIRDVGRILERAVSVADRVYQALGHGGGGITAGGLVVEPPPR